MPSAAGVVAKLDGALRKSKAYDRLIYKRTTTTSGGDPLIGRGSVKDTTDVLLDPPPVYTKLTRDAGSGNHTRAEMLLSGSGQVMQMSDSYILLVSPTAVSASDLANPTLTFVFKKPDGSEEVFVVDETETVAYQATDVMFTLYIKSVRRPPGVS